MLYTGTACLVVSEETRNNGTLLRKTYMCSTQYSHVPLTHTD